MTKDFFFLISYLFFLVFAPALHAQQNVPVLPAGVVCVDDYNNYYKINDDHSYTLTLVQGNQSAEGAETLPDCFYLSGLYAEGEMSKKYTVRDIGPSAFTGCHFVTAITLPAGLVSIGAHGFSRCSALTTLTLPAGLKSIGNYAFQACEKLTDIELPAGLTSIGIEAFYECRALTRVTLPDDLLSLGGVAFNSCSALEYVSMPASLLSQASKWDYQMFQYCSQELVHHVRCPQLPTAAEKAQMTAAMDQSFNRGSSKRPVVWTVPTVEWNVSPADGSKVSGGSAVTLTDNLRGQQLQYRLSSGGATGLWTTTRSGTVELPRATAATQSVTIEAQVLTNVDNDIELCGTATPPLSVQYTVRRQVAFDPGLASGDIAPKTNLTLSPTTSDGLNVTYKVNGKTKSASYTFPDATADAQTITIEAQATAPDDLTEIEGSTTRTYTYRVRGRRSFPEGLLTPAPGAIMGGYLLDLPPRTANGLALSYTVEGATLTGHSCAMPAADANTHQVTIVAQGAAPEGVDVVPPSRSYHYTVLGQRQYTDELRAAGAVEPEEVLQLPATTQDNMMTVSYSINGAPHTGSTFKFPKRGTAAQRYTVVATAAIRSDQTQNFELVGAASKTYEYVVQGLAPFAQELAQASGSTLAAPYKLPLPAVTDNGLTVSYTINGQPYTASEYPIPAAGTSAQHITVVATAVPPADVNLSGEATKTYVYTVRGQRSLTERLSPDEGPVAGGTTLTLPAQTSADSQGGLLNVTYTVNDEARQGSFPFPAATTVAQRFTVVAEGTLPSGVSDVDPVAPTRQTYQYTVRGQRRFTESVLPASGAVAGGSNLTLPSTTTDRMLLVTYTVAEGTGTARTAQGTYPFPTATADEQRITVVATAHIPSGHTEVDLVGEKSQTYEYSVRGQRSFTDVLEKPSGTIAAEYELTLPPTTANGLALSYTVDEGHGARSTEPGTFKFPSATSSAQRVTVVATASAPEGVDVVGGDTKSYEYLVLGLLRFEQELAKPSGAIEGEYELALPATTDNGLEVSYTVENQGTRNKEQGTYRFPAAGKTPQYRTVVATAHVPAAQASELELQGGDTKSYRYVVQGVVSFEHSLEKASGSVVDENYELTLPATANDGLTVTYTVDGEAFTEGKYTFGSASAHRYVIVAQAVAPADVVIEGSETKSYEYTVRGQVRFEWEPSKATGSVIANGYELVLPGETPNGLQLGYTLNGAPVAGKHTFEAQGTAQTYTLVATASVPEEVTEVQLVGDDTKSYEYTVRGLVAFEQALAKPSGSSLEGGYVLTLPALTDNGLAVSYTINGEAVSGSYTFPAATAVAQTITIVAQASSPAEDVDVEPTSKTYEYTVAARAALRVKEQGTGNKEHSATYDLSGRPVGKSHRGIVIRNKSLVISR